MSIHRRAFRAAAAAIVAQDAAQYEAAKRSLQALEQSKPFREPIVTQIVAPGPTFHRAEEYHQDYYRKNPVRHAVYGSSCGRDARLRSLWGTH